MKCHELYYFDSFKILLFNLKGIFSEMIENGDSKISRL